jgi:hypothetical protein
MDGTPRALYWLDAPDTNDQFGLAFSSGTATEGSSTAAT